MSQRLTSLLVFSFFGLTPQYRVNLFSQVHDLVFHGGGGFQYTEVYNMPIWLRLFHTNKISEYNQEQNDKAEQAQKGSSPDSNKIQGPNVSPSDTYNF